MKTFFILPSFLSKKSYETLCEFVCQIEITRIFLFNKRWKVNTI